MGVTDFRIIEAGGDFGGTWYWNRYPGAQCDIESYCYLPLLEELGLHAEGEVLVRLRRSSSTPSASASTTTCTTRRCFQTRVRSIDWDDETQALARHDQPRRRHQGPLRRHGARLGDAGQAARHPRHRRVRGPLVPHQPLGLRLHRRRHDRRDDRAGRQAGGDHRHRRDGDPVRAADGAGRWSTCTSSSARRRRSTGGATSRPTRTGGRRCSPAGSAHRRNNFGDMAAGRPVEVDLVDDGWTDIFRNVVSSPKGANRPKTREERDRGASSWPTSGR